jgi:Icc-related predicted phosphoesterase
MRIIAISDTHTKESWLTLPECDILIFAGDFHITSMRELEIANRWFKAQKAKHKIFIAGNHETFLAKYSKEIIQTFFHSVIYLQNSSVTLEGLKFYGSPYTPEFNNWAFMYPRRSKEAKDIWSKIPKDLDFLITHCPPYDILDRNLRDERCGCEVLQRELIKKAPKNHIFGHIHLNGGQCINEMGINFYNVSVLDEAYQLVNKPTIIEI